MKKVFKVVPPGTLCLMIIFVAIFIYSLLAPVLYPINLGATNLTERLLKPSIFGYSDSGYLLGTDYLGRDVAIRLLYATRNTMVVALSGLILAVVIGTTIGIICGLKGGWIDDFFVFIINTLRSIPTLIIGVIAATIFGGGQVMTILLIGFIRWTRFARYTRAQVLQVKQENFIECSKAIGSSTLRILFEHILVNIASPLIVTASLNLSAAVMLESTLSYLGLGILPPQTSLGEMVSRGRNYLLSHWWLAVVPIVVIVLIVLTFSLIGDWLRDVLDPKFKTRIKTNKMK